MNTKAKVTVVLKKHTKWDYSDYDYDQIKCSCGWFSKTFLPRTDEKAVSVFAAHQSEEVMKVLGEA